MIEDITWRCREFGDDTLLVEHGIPLAAAEFLERASSLCTDLRELGVTSGSRVVLSMVPGGDLFISIVATWLAGAAFVPVDPEEAPARRIQILADSQPAVILGQAGDHRVDCGIPWAAVSHGRVVASDGDGAQASCLLSPWPDEAYVIFTSGSTGRPKGVSVGHGAIATYVREACRIYEVPDDGMAFPLQLLPTFDAALTSVLPPLVTRNVAFPIYDHVSATRGLAEFLKSTTMHVLVKTTPSQLHLLSGLVDTTDVGRLSGAFVIGGEALTYDSIAWMRHAGQLRIFNEYGPTEATVGCAAYRVCADDPVSGPVPIGTPHRGASFSVDPEPGAREHDGSGDLVVTGPCLANGYVNDSNSDGFTHVDGKMSYRTGDRVYRDRAGDYHFLGRHDDQLKINGFRVEVGEIEAALRLAAGGRQAAVAVTEDTFLGVIEGTTRLDIGAVLTDLRRQLPAYMQPADIRVVSAIPLTSHGKIDRAQLLALLAKTDTTKVGAHSTACQEPDSAALPPLPPLVADLWCSLLGLDSVADDTDFFAVGDSITALRLIGRLATALGQDIPVSLIFDNSRLGIFIEALRIDLRSRKDDADPVDEDRTPAPPQLAILDAELWSQNEALFTVVDAVRATGIPNWTALESAIATTLTRHDIFNWRFERDETHRVIARGGRPILRATHHVETIDLRMLPPAEAEAVITDRLAEERLRRIELVADASSACPRALLFRMRPDATGLEAGVCAFVAHHAVMDEISADLVWTEVFARTNGERLDDGYDKRYEGWAREMITPGARRRVLRSAEEMANWLCAAPLGALTRTDHPDRPPTPVKPPLRFTVPTDLSARSVDAARRFAVPVSALYGAAIVRALGSVIAAPRFALFMPMTLRRSAKDFEAVGCFVATVPVLAECPPVAEAASLAAVRWHKSVGFAAQRADADPARLAERLQVAAPGWFMAARALLAIESPHAGRIGAVEWSSLALFDKSTKYDLSIFLTPGTRRRPGSGRLVWRSGFADRAMVGAVACTLAERFTDALEAFCGGGNLPPLPRPDARPPLADIAAERDSRAAQEPAPPPGRRPPARGATARGIAALAGKVLHHSLEVGDDLIAAGARSLDLMRLTAEIKRTYGVLLSAVDVFDCSTPANLAALVEMRCGATHPEGDGR